MKRILAIALTLIMLIAFLTGCMASKNPSGSEGEQPKQAQCLSEEDGVYKLTLPKSKEVIELYEEQVRFVPYITDELVETAENKINEAVSAYSNSSDFYLQIRSMGRSSAQPVSTASPTACTTVRNSASASKRHGGGAARRPS